MIQYRVQKHRSQKMATAIKSCETYIAQGIPAWVISCNGYYAVCFGRYKHRESAEALRDSLRFNHQVRNIQIVQED